MSRQLSISVTGATEYLATLRSRGAVIPIEQVPAWAAIDRAVAQREPLGQYFVHEGEELVAAFSLTRVLTRGLSYLWLRHGPVWLREPSAEDEAALIEVLRELAAEIDPGAVHLRLDLRHPHVRAVEPHGLITYDETAVIDTSVSDTSAEEEILTEEILSHFKPRGRRDVRKAVRESGVVCADETERARRDFSEYHAVMVETADRDGFTPWGEEFYRMMIRELGVKHCRLFAGRIDGELVCWSIVTISGATAWRHHAAMANSALKRRVTDRLILAECVWLASRGVERYDLMGIGSELSPQLMGLNEFKLKFVKEATQVAPTMDVPLRAIVHHLLISARGVVRAVRALAH